MPHDRHSIHGLILAGGQSLRMGTDKALLQVSGKPMLIHMMMQMKAIGLNAITIAVNNLERERVYREAIKGFEDHVFVQFAHDHYVDCGPIAGLHAGLTMMPKDCYAFVLACDMPMLSVSLFDRMAVEGSRQDSQSAVEVIRTPLQPFHALYHTSIVPKLQHQLEQRELRMMRSLELLQAIVLLPSPTEEEAFHNLNTPEDYDRYMREAKGRGRK